MEFVTAVWCIEKQLMLEQTIRNLIFEDVEMSLVVIRLGVTRLKSVFNSNHPGSALTMGEYVFSFQF